MTSIEATPPNTDESRATGTIHSTRTVHGIQQGIEGDSYHLAQKVLPTNSLHCLPAHCLCFTVPFAINVRNIYKMYQPTLNTPFPCILFSWFILGQSMEHNKALKTICITQFKRYCQPTLYAAFLLTTCTLPVPFALTTQGTFTKHINQLFMLLSDLSPAYHFLGSQCISNQFFTLPSCLPFAALTQSVLPNHLL
jgi:hypothetical protein